MSKKIIFLILLFSIQSVLAQPTEDTNGNDVAEIIKDVQEALKNNPNSGYNCPTCEQASPIELCRQSLCADVPESFGDIALDAASALAIDDGYLDTIFPLVDKAVHSDMANKRRVLSAINDWMGSAPSTSDPEIVPLLNALPILSAVDFEVSYDYETRKRKLSFSELTTGSLSPAEKKLLEKRAAYYLKKYEEIPFTQMTDSTSVGLIFSRQELPEKIKEATNEIVSSAKWVRENSKSVFLKSELASPYWSEVQKKRFGEGSLNPAALSDLAEDLLTIRIYRDLIENEEVKDLFSSESLDIKNYFKKNKMQVHLSSQIESLDAYLNLEKPFGRDDPCLSAYSLGQTYLPSQADLPDIRRRANASKKEFISKMKSIISDESYARLKPVMEAWEISLPQSRESHAKQFAAELEKHIFNIKNEKQNIEQKLSSADKDEYLMHQALRIQKINYVDLYSIGPLSACANLVPDLVPDAALTETGRISVGPLSIQNEDAGKNTLAHELGHQLFEELKKTKLSQTTAQWFEESQKCVISGHKSNGQQYLSEDWADLMSAQVALSSKNLACHLFGNSALTQGGASLINEYDQDPHSSGFYRLMNWEVQSGRAIPQACRAALDAKKETLQIKSCVQKAQQ